MYTKPFFVRACFSAKLFDLAGNWDKYSAAYFFKNYALIFCKYLKPFIDPPYFLYLGRGKQPKAIDDYEKRLIT